LALALVSVLERISVYEHKGKYQDQLVAAKQLLSIFAQFRTVAPSRSVAEGTVEMWERIRADQDLADVEFVIGGDSSGSYGALEVSPESSGSIFAHSLVLCHASPVLRASLSSGMREGQTRVVQVPGANLAAMHLLLAIVYSGSLPDDGKRKPPIPRDGGNVALTLVVGDAVEANWKGRGRWWRGRVAALQEDGSCDVVYDGEGDFTERDIAPPRLRLPQDARRAPSKNGKPSCNSAAAFSSVCSPRTQLLALDVAHRWQVNFAVTLLEQSLAEHVRDTCTREGMQGTRSQLWLDGAGTWDDSLSDRDRALATFELLCEAASLKDLPTLRAACRRRASECYEVKRHYERGRFGQLAARELEDVFD
jgi:hypothetical protein